MVYAPEVPVKLKPAQGTSSRQRMPEIRLKPPRTKLSWPEVLSRPHMLFLEASLFYHLPLTPTKAQQVLGLAAAETECLFYSLKSGSCLSYSLELNF